MKSNVTNSVSKNSKIIYFPGKENLENKTISLQQKILFCSFQLYGLGNMIFHGDSEASKKVDEIILNLNELEEDLHLVFQR